MGETSRQWTSLGEPASDAEREALDAVRALLPDDAIAHGWANLTFIATRGTRVPEVDVLLMVKSGLYLLELKGWRGRITSNQQSWRQEAPNGRVRHDQNPVIVTEAKARLLAGLLQDVARNDRERRSLPFVRSLVVVHGRDSRLELDDATAAHVVALDGFGVKGVDRTLGQVIASAPQDLRDAIDGPRATEIRRLLSDRAGFQPTPRNRMVGEYSLDKADPLEEGPFWRDFRATHPSAPSVVRRIRLFTIPPGASAAARADIERTCRREFVITRGVQHTGIASPADIIESDLGPALVFDHDDEAMPLADYLSRHGAELGIDERLGLVRQLGDALRHAHRAHLVHRSLTPRQVYVTPGTPPRLVVRDWQGGRRSTGSATPTATSFGTVHVRDLVLQDSWVYLAPEAHLGADDVPPIPLDVYGAGALAYLMLTGEPPARTLAELQERLDRSGALDPRAVNPSLPDAVADLVVAATRRIEADRTSGMDAFLAQLDAAQKALAAPPQAPVEERPRATDPLEARTGDTLDERFIVQEHRGQGSTGVVLLVDDVDTAQEGLVLKVARDDGAARRLRDEAEVLAGLHHRRLVRLVAPPLQVGGRTALLLTDAGRETLAARIQEHGRATVLELERFGADLLDAIAYLDGKGLFHRDIKPANLGVHADPGTRRPSLVLFDLSLAREPLENLGSGTRGYVDPYLPLSQRVRGKARRRFDRPAELWALTVTLFEMATAQLPWWSDGELAPASFEDRVVVAPEMFEPAIAGELVTFFRRAFAPDVAERFADLATMAQAWQQVFASLEPADDEADEAARDEAAAHAELNTPLSRAGLTARALSGLHRLGVQTVGDLLGTSPMRINSVTGLGESYRKEIQRRARQWRHRLQDSTTGHGVALGSNRSIEVFLARLVPKEQGSEQPDEVLEMLLGAGDATDGSLWPVAAEVAARLGQDRADVASAVDGAVERWLRSSVVRDLKAEVTNVLRSLEGVASVAEVARAMLLRHGSMATGDLRMYRAAGLVRVVIEVDQKAAEPRFATRRLRGGVVMLAAVPEGGTLAEAHALLDAAAALADEAAALSAQGHTLVPESVARAALRDVPLHRADVTPNRLLHLAAAGAPEVELSTYQELYRTDVDVADVARAVLRGLPVTELTPEGVRSRVAHRFPALPPLPGRPALDAIVQGAIPGMVWQGTAYARPTQASTALSSSRTVVRTHPTDVIDGRLRASLQRSSALTLCATPHRYERTAAVLPGLYGVVPVDVAALLHRSVRDLAADDDVEWDLVLRTDADPASPDRDVLTGLVAEAVSGPWEELMSRAEPLLLVNAAPLARYGLTRLLSEVLDQANRRPAARWLLVPRRSSQPHPLLDGRPVPLGVDGYLDLPADLTTLRPGVPA